MMLRTLQREHDGTSRVKCIGRVLVLLMLCSAPRSIGGASGQITKMSTQNVRHRGPRLDLSIRVISTDMTIKKPMIVAYILCKHGSGGIAHHSLFMLDPSNRHFVENANAYRKLRRSLGDLRADSLLTDVPTATAL